MPLQSVSGKASSDIENDWGVGTGGHFANVVRFGSSSSQASQSSGDICRICHCESDPQNPLLTPCYCSGSLKYVHQACLQQWLTASETNSCELCKFPFIMHTKIKPFNEWRSLEMSGVERRRLFCAVLFHFAAALCVIWSLCVLIERAAEEVKRGQIGWPFWTKLVVVTVGLTGGVVFMYIQCRQYLHLCNRWRARNRILLIQNAPEKFHPPQSPIMHTKHMPRNNSTTASIPGILGGNDNTSSSNFTQNNNRSQMHGQIVANIENNPNHYERDWTLDDVSQMSFKPCIQGSGSLTPFHDSVNNMYENQMKLNSGGESSSHNSSNEHIFNQISDSSSGGGGGGGNISLKRTNDLRLFKIESEQMIKYPASAVFLENRDILNDGGPSAYSKLYHRHSAIITAPTNLNENLDKLLGKDVRRYSDTRLSQITSSQKQLDQLQQQTQQLHHNNQLLPSNQIFNVTNVLGSNISPMPELATNSNPINNQPQVTDIIFERTGVADDCKTNFDPLELNIQEMLELDIQTQKLNKKSRLSLNQNNLGHCINIRGDNYFRSSSGGDDVENLGSQAAVRGNGRNYIAVTNEKKKIFKSLPNLNASSENLLQ